MSAGPDLKREERDKLFKRYPSRKYLQRQLKNSTRAKDTSIRRQQKWTEKKKSSNMKHKANKEERWRRS